MSSKCPKGQIMRKAYSKKKGSKVTRVPASCITDKGKPGKGKQLFRIPEYDVGLLSDYGYSLSKKHADRAKAIKQASKEKGMLGVLRHLVAIRTLSKSNEQAYKKLDKDIKWFQGYYQSRTKKSSTKKSSKKASKDI